MEQPLKGKKILINCDSKTAIRSINHTIIKNIDVTPSWIPAHSVYEGNELANHAAKVGSANKTNSADKYNVLLPIPRNVGYVALRRNTLEDWTSSYKADPRMFSMMWMDRFAKELCSIGRKDLRGPNILEPIPAQATTSSTGLRLAGLFASFYAHPRP